MWLEEDDAKAVCGLIKGKIHTMKIAIIGSNRKKARRDLVIRDNGSRITNGVKII
jgi:hypothetical protein